MTDKFIIVDLDGTLCDCSGRVHLAQAGLWDEFNAACGDDKPIASTVGVLKILTNANYDFVPVMIALTGRSAKFRLETERWITTHAPGLIDEVLMRPEHDYRPDGEVKIGLLEELFGSKEAVLESVLVVLDDRDRVVQALRDYGLTVWQVREGDY